MGRSRIGKGREECLKVITQQRDESDNAVLLIKTFLADTYSRLDRHKDAIDLYLECAGIYAKEIPPREDYFYALNCLVVEYCLLDDIPSAIQYRSQAANLVHRLHGVGERYARQKWLQGEPLLIPGETAGTGGDVIPAYSFMDIASITREKLCASFISGSRIPKLPSFSASVPS